MFTKLKHHNTAVFTAILIGLTALLSGCEARLDLTKVEASKKDPVTRSDNFQAAARSPKAIIIVGNRGVILRSADNGTSWQRQQLPGSSPVSRPTLVDADICPDNHFVVLDTERRLWISDASGTNWSSKPIPTKEEVLDLTCDPAGHLWVVGSFTLILESRDGGDSWTDKSIAEDAMFSRVQFTDRDHGIITGEFGSVYRTSDGGNSWQAGNAIPHEFYPMASYFKNIDEGWVGGLQGIIFHTSDAGRTWQRQKTGIVAPLYTIFAAENGTYAIGEQGTMLRLTGNDWQPVSAQAGFGYLRAALPLAGKKLLIAGDGGLIRTLDPQKLH